MNSLRKSEIYTLSFLMAFCSIAYELLMASTLARLSANQTLWQAITVGVFIGGLGIGSFFASSLKNTIKTILRVEILLSLIGIVCSVYVYFAHSSYRLVDNLIFYSSDFHLNYYNDNIAVFKILYFFIVEFLVFAIGFLSGIEMPSLMNLLDEKKIINYENKIYSLNYLGTLVGTLVLSYYFLPYLDVIKSAVIIGLLNLLITAYLIYKLLKNNVKYWISVSLIFILSMFIWINESKITQGYLKVIYYTPIILLDLKKDDSSIIKILKALPNIERTKSLYQYLDLFDYDEKIDNFSVKSKVLALDTNFQLSTATERYYHQAFSHVPIMLANRVPKRVLVLGGGDGFLVRELLKYENIKNIKLIELDQKVVDLALNEFRELNNNSLKEPRVSVEVGDGFYFVKNSNEKYDAIFIDFPYPNSYDLLRLYSVEFYRFVYNRLDEDGFVVIDAPFYDSGVEFKPERGENLGIRRVPHKNHFISNSVFASTFNSAGFMTFYPYAIGEESFAFLRKKENSLDYNFSRNQGMKFLDYDIFLEVEKIPSQKYEFEISKQYINSIFKPYFVKRN